MGLDAADLFVKERDYERTMAKISAFDGIFGRIVLQ